MAATHPQHLRTIGPSARAIADEFDARREQARQEREQREAAERAAQIAADRRAGHL